MEKVANWSGLVDHENCVKKIDRVTQWRYFLFTKDPKNIVNIKEKPFCTKFFVKKIALIVGKLFTILTLVRIPEESSDFVLIYTRLLRSTSPAPKVWRR